MEGCYEHGNEISYFHKINKIIGEMRVYCSLKKVYVTLNDQGIESLVAL